MAGPSRAARPPVGSVARAVQLLDVLADHPRGLGVNELGRRMGVNASTASRLAATLEQAGLLEREPGGPFRLGLKLIALADRVLESLDVRERARPWLECLVEQTGETATLSVAGRGEAITVDFVPSAASVVSMARVGRPSVPHATATGKVMLAFSPPEAPDAGARLERYTERTVTDPVALARELEEVRRRGVAQAVGEREPDLAAVAAPVFGRGGGLAAIIGIQGPVGRLTAARREAVRDPLNRAAAEISAALGGPGASFGRRPRSGGRD